MNLPQNSIIIPIMSDSSATLQQSDCPSCGAPVSFSGLADDVTEVKCQYCGTLIQRPFTRAPAHPHAAPNVIIKVPSVTYSTAWVRPAAAAATVVGGSGCVIAIASVLLPLLIVGGLLFVVNRGPITSAISRLIEGNSNAMPAPLVDAARKSVNTFTPPPITVQLLGFDQRDGAALADPFVVTTDEYKEYFVGLVNSQTKLLRWRVPVSKDYTALKVVQTSGTVLISDSDQLLGVDGATGSVKWRASLSRALQTNCETCLIAANNAAVTLARDGTIQGFDAQTGAQLWSKKGDAATRRMYPLGDKFGVAEQVPGKNSAYAFAIYSLATGERIRLIEGACSNGSFKNDARNDTYRLSPDGQAVYAVWDGNYPCLQRYDANTGAKTWERALKSGEFPFSLGSSSTAFFVGNNTIYGYADGTSSTAGTLFSFDAKTGAGKKFELEKNYRLRFIDTFAKPGGGELLITRAQSQFDQDRERTEVWALDASAGQIAWKSTFSAPGKDMDKFDAAVGTRGIVAWQCINKICNLFHINAQNGTTSAPTAAGFSAGSASWYRFTDTTLWMSTNRELKAVDLETGAVKLSW